MAGPTLPAIPDRLRARTPDRVRAPISWGPNWWERVVAERLTPFAGKD
jgi:hypothetical protein